MAAAWLEIVAGIVFVTAINVVCEVLFAVKPEGVGIVFGRFAGVVLFALGIACLPSRAPAPLGKATVGLFIFNAGIAMLFAWVGFATTLRGVLLWPVFTLHAVIAAALLPQLLARRKNES
jgi:hypothetical protein